MTLTLTIVAAIGVIPYRTMYANSFAWFSLHDWNLISNDFKFSGLDNYAKILADPNMPAIEPFELGGAAAGAGSEV